MPKVLVVDDEPGMRASLRAFLRAEGYEVETAEDVPSALACLERCPVDVVVSDIVMPGASGVQLLKLIRQADDGVVAVLITGEPSVESAAEATQLGAFDYLAKPLTKQSLLGVVARAARTKEQHDLNLALTEENERYRMGLEDLVSRRTAQLEAALRGTVGVVGQTLQCRDPYTASHQRRVAALAKAIATEMGQPNTFVEGVEMSALLHDLGKIAVPSEILSKPSALTQAEFALIKEHCVVGYEILKDVEFPWPIATTVLQHHERLDGSGYPKGLIGQDITLEARIVAVADVTEAIASNRPYRPALGIHQALKEIQDKRGIAYDPQAADACLALFAHGRFSFTS